MSAKVWFAALAWGAFSGLVTSAMTGIWWQFPYWVAATIIFTTLFLGLMIWEAIR